MSRPQAREESVQTQDPPRAGRKEEAMSEYLQRRLREEADDARLRSERALKMRCDYPLWREDFVRLALVHTRAAEVYERELREVLASSAEGE